MLSVGQGVMSRVRLTNAVRFLVNVLADLLGSLIALIVGAAIKDPDAGWSC